MGMQTESGYQSLASINKSWIQSKIVHPRKAKKSPSLDLAFINNFMNLKFLLSVYIFVKSWPILALKRVAGVEMRVNFLVLMLVFFASDRSQAAARNIGCLSVKELDSKIHYCSENKIAFESAKTCFLEIITSLHLASSGLSKLQKFKGKSQQEEVDHMEMKYDDAIKELTQFIEHTKRQANVIARYPTVMVDSPGITNEIDSLPCYKEPFTQIQKLVDNLDKKIDEGLNTLHLAIAQKESTQLISQHLDSKSSNTLQFSAPRGAQSKPSQQAAGFRAPASEISRQKEETK